MDNERAQTIKAVRKTVLALDGVNLRKMWKESCVINKHNH